MELRLLRYFLAVAREGNITKAASVLHISQPALSKQLAGLEAELGQPLFLRGSRKVTLTPYGELLARRAQEMLDLADRTRAEFARPEETVTGDLRVGCGEGRPVGLVARAMARMHRVYPEVLFHLFTGLSGEVLEKLAAGKLDFGTVNAAASLEGLNFLRLPLPDRWGVVMRRDDPRAAWDSVDAGQLAALPLIVSRHALLRNELSGWLGGSMQALQIVATCDMHRNASLLVRAGMGYLLSYDLPLSDDALCFKPLSPSCPSAASLVWREDGPLSPAAEAFLRMMREEAGGSGL